MQLFPKTNNLNHKSGMTYLFSVSSASDHLSLPILVNNETQVFVDKLIKKERKKRTRDIAKQHYQRTKVILQKMYFLKSFELI